MCAWRGVDVDDLEMLKERPKAATGSDGWPGRPGCLDLDWKAGDGYRAYIYILYMLFSARSLMLDEPIDLLTNAASFAITAILP